MANDPSTAASASEKCSCDDRGLIPHVVELEQKDGYRFHARFINEGGELWMDEVPPLGPGDGPEGVTLLAGAAGYCMSASLVFALNKLRIEPTKLESCATARLKRIENRLRRVSCIGIEIHIEIDEQYRKPFERALEFFGQYCIVSESIRGNFPIYVTVHHPWGIFEREIPPTEGEIGAGVRNAR